MSFHALGATSGENSIIIVGGANQAEWALSDAAKAEIAEAGKSHFAACLDLLGFHTCLFTGLLFPSSIRYLLKIASEDVHLKPHQFTVCRGCAAAARDT